MLCACGVPGAWGYPNGTIEQRIAIRQRHIEYITGLLWRAGWGAACLVMRQHDCLCRLAPLWA